MKLNIKLPHLLVVYLTKLKPIVRHHYFIVMVLLFGSVSAAVFMVNSILNQPSDTEYYDQQIHSTIGSKFNQNTKDTIEKIKALQKSSDTNSPQTPLPSGRINPFAE